MPTTGQTTGPTSPPGRPGTTGPGTTAPATGRAPLPATGLVAFPDCVGTPPRPVVVLRWTPSATGGQRVDVATGDGLATGSFRSSELLPADAGVLSWTQAQGEAEHHWRVLTQDGGEWVPSAEGVFNGPGCVGADRQ